VDAQGLHGLVCKQAPSRIIRHHALNDVVARTIQSAGIPVTKEQVGLTRLDGKRPDGLTLIPWQGGTPLTWDVTVVSTLPASYLSSSAQSAGATADLNVNGSPLSPSRQRPQTGPFAIPRIYPSLDISLTKNLRDFRINLATSLTLILFMSSGSKTGFPQMLILVVT